MSRIAVGIEYDGSAYAGWQAQGRLPTIQHVTQIALSRVAGEPVTLVCAGRTDAGVHAYGQVAHFDARDPQHARLGSWRQQRTAG